jgi:hypothetical protein
MGESEAVDASPLASGRLHNILDPAVTAVRARRDKGDKPLSNREDF